MSGEIKMQLSCFNEFKWVFIFTLFRRWYHITRRGNIFICFTFYNEISTLKASNELKRTFAFGIFVLVCSIFVLAIYEISSTSSCSSFFPPSVHIFAWWWTWWMLFEIKLFRSEIPCPDVLKDFYCQHSQNKTRDELLCALGCRTWQFSLLMLFFFSAADTHHICCIHIESAPAITGILWIW